MQQNAQQPFYKVYTMAIYMVHITQVLQRVWAVPGYGIGSQTLFYL